VSAGVAAGVWDVPLAELASGSTRISFRVASGGRSTIQAPGFLRRPPGMRGVAGSGFGFSPSNDPGRSCCTSGWERRCTSGRRCDLESARFASGAGLVAGLTFEGREKNLRDARGSWSGRGAETITGTRSLHRCDASCLGLSKMLTLCTCEYRVRTLWDIGGRGLTPTHIGWTCFSLPSRHRQRPPLG